jgi:hypothetical protein
MPLIGHIILLMSVCFYTIILETDNWLLQVVSACFCLIELFLYGSDPAHSAMLVAVLALLLIYSKRITQQDSMVNTLLITSGVVIEHMILFGAGKNMIGKLTIIPIYLIIVLIIRRFWR